jgi:hypothetical protein
VKAVERQEARMTMKRSAARFGLFVWTLTAMPVAPATAAGPKYTFVRIADSLDFAEIRVPVALNDAGQVAFVAILPTGVTGVFVGGDGAVTTVADDTQDFVFFGFPGINGRGQATFYGGKADRTGFYAGAGGATVLIENRGAVQAFVGDIYSSPSGAFSVGHAILRLPGFQQEIVVGKGGRATRVADTSGLFQSLDLDPRVNASGRVAFSAIRRDSSEGIFVGEGGALTTVADTSGPFVSFSPSPAINDWGHVLFQAVLADFTTTGLFLSRQGKISTVLDSTGAFAGFGTAPALNRRGQIAFEGTTWMGLLGIFTGGDPVADRVIAVDDPLDGSTVQALDVLAFDAALNDRGQIAFIATLADGRTGVYRADPTKREDRGAN